MPYLLWQYLKNVAWQLLICDGCFTQVCESWPVASYLSKAVYNFYMFDVKSVNLLISVTEQPAFSKCYCLCFLL